MTATTHMILSEGALIARKAAAHDVGSENVGAHAEHQVEEPGVVTHYFNCLLAGYQGWRWAVTVAQVSDSAPITVSEVVLLPGDGALTPPEWVPFGQRLQPGDLGAGDVLPTAPDDHRLVPSYTSTDITDFATEELWELGHGRPRVLSREGRHLTTERWRAGEFGATAKSAPSSGLGCASCGFLVPIAGALGQAFGVCANEMTKSDGSVVSLNFGCGAHSEIEVPSAAVALPATVLDDLVVIPLILDDNRESGGDMLAADDAAELVAAADQTEENE